MAGERMESSLLEIEAANYFELDSNQVQLLSKKSLYLPTEDPIAQVIAHQVSANKTPRSNMIKHKRRHDNKSIGKQEPARTTSEATRNGRKSIVLLDKQYEFKARRHKQSTGKTPSSSLKTRPTFDHRHRAQVGPNYSLSVLASADLLLDSSTASTNSLPSISSSPSMSPSLVCPHLSLDDILSRRTDSKSPHTIGLCATCRLNPPPDVHSPLSPAFKPSSIQVNQNKQVNKFGPVRRGYSDHQLAARPTGPHQATAKAGRIRRLTGGSSGLDMRDDSLDYYLEPKERSRMLMSPSLRNSVEFIRNNSIEAGRVLRIFKNGEPFDKPLRVCIARGEFSSLNHLLDHINSRQLIQSGARYLFHLDGQLVYSVNELKHDSIYIVSGTRSFDTRTANAIRDEERKRQQLALASSQKLEARINFKPYYMKRTSSNIGSNQSLNNLPVSRPERKGPSVHIANASAAESSEERYPPEAGMQTNQVRCEKVDRSSESSSQICRASQVGRTKGKTTDQPRGFSERNHHKAGPTVALEDDVMTKSSEYLIQDTEKPIRKTVVRAKSELSALPNKRKKNVTFEDTGRGSSPAIVGGNHDDYVTSEKKGTQNDLGDKEAQLTNDIGIQVSDSIEGFLIDLPIAIPRETGPEDELPIGVTNKSSVGGRKRKQTKDSRSNVNSEKNTAHNKAGNRLLGNKLAKRPIVTITERQLSLEEMDQLKDLDHGDHHSELSKIQHVTIKLESVESFSDADVENEPNQQPKDEMATAERLESSTINIGQSIDDGRDRQAEEAIIEAPKWQSPSGEGDRGSTPAERPVSQSDANEIVHARVTTPTPSMSTTGDNSSLSYENQQSGSIELPVKRQVPICGRLCPNGLDPPTRNFKLIWVNGFSINNRYPENSLAGQHQVAASTREEQQVGEAHLIPSATTSEGRRTPSLVELQFKPNERFQNWICHSKRHDELLYPAGCLVVLWCRPTGEQRFYGQHTSNVSALTLASPHADLAISAQEPDLTVKRRAGFRIWSLSSLDTLHVLDDDQLGDGRIFSLDLRLSPADEGTCEILLAARDDKRLWLYAMQFGLVAQVNNETRASSTKKSVISSININKPLQPNQSPFLITRLSRLDQQQRGPNSNKMLNDTLLSFGRRHFQLWAPDKRRRGLNLLKVDNKSAQFGVSIVKANCLIRISPGELIIGDSDGNINLLLLTLGQPTSSSEASKYTIKLVPLVGQSDDAQTTNSTSKILASRMPAITSLLRISSNLFASGDANCALRFWRIIRSNEPTPSDQDPIIECKQVRCIALPRDLGFICSLILSNYSSKRALVELYIVFTSNAILFGSMHLSEGFEGPDGLTLSIVYEGHESWVMSLVADRVSRSGDAQFGDYFTCSLDCKICKWNGKSLIWKSLLPSACASLAVHPTGFVLAVGAADGTVYVLDKVSGLLISYFPLTPVCINCLAYSRDGSLLAAGCANGTIFILPVYERGLKYKKVSIFQSPYPVVSLQFSTDNRYILTSVTHGSYQELILWDLPNFKYMRENVEVTAEKIDWFDSICSGSEDVRAIWENANIPANEPTESTTSGGIYKPSKLIKRFAKPKPTGRQSLSNQMVVNLSCHRLIRTDRRPTPEETPGETDFVIASDTRGYLRLFRYPCYDTQQGFYEARVSSSAANCCRFLAPKDRRPEAGAMFVSTSLDGSIFLWALD